MPKFTVRSFKDAYTVYTCEVEADSADEAVDLVYEGHVDVDWTYHDVVEFDAVRMSAIDADWNQISDNSRGKA